MGNGFGTSEMHQKRGLKGSICLGACMLGTAVIGSGSAAAAETDTWLLVLQQQLDASVSCSYEHIVWVKSFELAGAVVIDGRVRCMDGREFYFTRPKPHLAFELRECEPAIC